MFREVNFPADVPGRLLLHSMPGRWEPLQSFLAEGDHANLTGIVRLTDLAELRQKSPEYADALQEGRIPCEVLACEMPDYGVPGDRRAFWALARDVAGHLKDGQVWLVHCGAGIGRTGAFAAAVLIALGQPVELARLAVSKAGSGSETDDQLDLIAWCAVQADKGR